MDSTTVEVATSAQVATTIPVDTTTVETTTTEAATTTTVDVGERLRPLLVRGDAAALDLAAPGSAAHLYIDGIVLSAAYGAPGTGPRFDDFVLDDAGLVTDFTRDGVPLSTLIFTADASATAGDTVATFHSVRYFDQVQLFALVDNTAGANRAYFQWESYVTPDGQQFEVTPALIPSDGVMPGARSIIVYTANTTTRGGIATGKFIGGGELVVQLPG